MINIISSAIKTANLGEHPRWYVEDVGTPEQVNELYSDTEDLDPEDIGPEEPLKSRDPMEDYYSKDSVEQRLWDKSHQMKRELQVVLRDYTKANEYNPETEERINQIIKNLDDLIQILEIDEPDNDDNTYTELYTPDSARSDPTGEDRF